MAAEQRPGDGGVGSGESAFRRGAVPSVKRRGRGAHFSGQVYIDADAVLSSSTATSPRYTPGDYGKALSANGALSPDAPDTHLPLTFT